MSAFDELLEQRKNRKAKGGTAFDELLATREYNKTQKAAYNTLKGINLEGIQSAVAGGNYIDRNTMNKYKYDLSTYIDNYSRLDTGNDDKKNKTLKDLTDFQNNFLKYYDYMTKFGNETDFNKNRYGWLTDDENFVDSDENVKGRQDIYEANKKRISEIDDLIKEEIRKDYHAGFIWDKSDTVIALEEEKNALIAENRQYEHGQGRTDSYFNLTKNEDFEKDSQNRDYTNPSRQDYQNYQARIDNGITYDTNGVGRDVFGEVFDEGYYDRIKEPETTDRLGLFLSTPEDQRQEAYASPAGLENGWEMVMKEGNSGDWDQLRDKEIDIYYYLLENSGKDAADKYLDEMTQELNRRATVKRTEAINEADGLEKVMLNIASVPFSVYGGILSFAEDALNTLSGNEINPYSQAYYFSNTAQDIRASTAQDIDEWTGGAKVLNISLGDAYQAGMSALDSVLGAKSMGRGYTYAMGAGAASTEAKKLYEQGASSAQIAAGSLLAGTAEAFFEHFSLEHYFTKFIEAPPASRTKAILQVLAQGGIEASEEVATEIANTISNAIVMGSESEWHDLMQKYKDEGESDAAAFGHALVNDVLLDKVWGAGAGGLISGVLMGGFGTTIGRVQYNDAVKAHGQGIIDSRGVDTLRQLANDVAGVNAPAVNAEAGADVNTETDAAPQLRGKDAKSVSKALAKVDGKASAKNVGRLSEAVENAISGKNKSDIQQSLVKEGMSQKDAKKASEILSKVMEDSEYEFTDKEVSKLFDDTYAANEDGITAVGKVLADIIADPASEQNMRKLELTVARLGRDLNTTPVANKKTKSGDTAILSNADVKDKVSYEGKTVNSETNEEISININDAIKSVKTVNGQRTVLLNTDKGVVDSLNVKYASEDQAYLIESVTDLSPVVANSIIKHYDGKMDVKEYVNGMREGILLYGKYNFTGVGTDISRNSFFARLSEADQALALEIGKSVAKSQAKKAQRSIAKTIRNAAESASEANKTTEGTNANVKAKKGKVRFEKGAMATTTAQKNGVKLAAHLARALGIDIYFYDSKVDTKYSDKNGWFNKADNSIHLDLQAGDLNEQTIAFTMAHELTHFIEKWSPEKYKVFSDFLIEQYGKHGMSVEDMLSEKMDILGKDDPDFAMSELVADACEEMLLDSDAMVKLAQLRAKDAGLFEKIKAKIAELLNNLKNIYAEGNFKPNSAEANSLRKMTDVIEQMHRMFEDAAVDAAQNYQAISETRQTLSDNGITIDDATGDVSFNSVRYTAGKNGVKSTEEIAKLVSNVTGRSYEESLRWVKAEMSVSNMILGKPEFLDFEPDERYDFIKNNSDYPQGTVDPNNLCRKREEFTTMFDMLQKMYPNKTFTAMDVANMRKILADKGIVVACGACFVEDRRQLLGEIADTYIGMWKEAVETGKPLQKTNAEGVKKTMTVTAKMAKTYGLVKGNTFMATDKYIPTQYDLTTYEGFRQLEKNHPMTAYGFIAYNNSRGQQAARLIEGRAEYKRQILSWSDAKVKRTNNQGGLRIFSFSDFQAVSMLDIIQVIIDCSAKGVKIQGYTKVPEFAKLVRNTGIKLNRSLMPKGETGIKTVDGKKVLDYDTTEGIDINDKDFLDESDNPDVGNILVGINAEQIGMAFLDDFVDYIIPFHTNKSKDVCKALGLATWQNYKESQHEKDIESGKASKNNVNIYTQVISKYNPQNKVEFVDAFLAECRKQKKIPRYAEFLNKNYTEDGAYTDEGGRFDYTYREGYHKLLIDFKMFDKAGNILLQQNVTPDMDSSFMSEILEREVERKENYTFPQEVFEEIKAEYGDDTQASTRSKDSQGRELSEGQQEYFKDSKVRDKDGNLLVMYHGTKAQFSVFDRDHIGSTGRMEGSGFNFTPSESRARSYSDGTVLGGYLKIANPISADTKTLTVRSLAKIISEIDPTGDNIIANYAYETRDYGKQSFINRESLTTAKAIVEFCENDADIYAELSSANPDANSLINKFQELGYDGVIHYNEDGSIKTAVTFDSNQFKDADNLNPTDNEDINYSLRKGAADDVEKALNDRNYTEDVYLTDSSPSIIANQQGAKNLPMLMKASHIRENIFSESEAKQRGLKTGEHYHYHGLGEELFLKIIDGLDEVNLAYRGTKSASDPSRRENYFLLVSQYKDASGNVINVPVYINEKGQYNRVFIDTNKVATVFGRDDFWDYIQREVKKGNLVRIKTRSPQTSELKATHASSYSKGTSINNPTTPSPESQEENQNSTRNPNAISDRTLLANALESTAQNDIEKKYIADYKANIDKLEELQAHLDEVNAEIKELSFSKGKRDSEKLKKLNEDKLKTANRINILDKKLLRLEAAKPLEQVLEREKNKAAKRAKAKADEAMARYREKSAAKLDDTVKKYQDARKKNVENRNKTAVRNKIKKVVGELDSLLNRGDRKRNVKNGMRDAVSDAISTAKVLFSAMDAQDIILDGVTTATPQEQIQIDKYVQLVDEMDKIAEQIENDGESTELVKQMDEKYKKLKYIERQLKGLIVRERIRLQTEGTSAALQKLADAYRELSASSKTHINGSYDQNVYDMIINLKDTAGGTSIQDMSIEQLESVYKVYKLIKHTVTESNKIFREGKAEDVATTAERVCREFVANEEPLDSRSKLRISGENFLWNELKPAYAIKMMNSPTMSEMYHDFELAEDIVATDIREAYEFASKTRDKYNYNDWDLKATVPVKLSSGTTVELTVKKMMSIYAYSKRDHALEHMSGGGFVLNNKETFRKTKGNGKKSLLKYVPTARYAFRIYDIDLQNIADILGKEKCGYVDEMQKYLSYDMGGKGNEASNIVYGIDIFTEQYYFPLKSAEAFIFSANQPAGEVSLKNSGMTKELVPHANNPIVLEDFDDVWAEHVNKMSTYHGFVVPIDNFNKVMNYTGYRNADMSSSVQTTMESVYGLASYAYMKKLIQDLNGGVAADKVKSPLAGFVGKFKKTAVAASGSVVIQQPTAIVRAMSMISPKYFKVDTKLSHGAKWEQLKKYAPVAVIKEIGGFDAGSGKTVVQYLNGNRSIMEAIDEKMMRPAGFADELGWNIIWDACKNEIADTTNLTGEELLQKAGERFSEVIRATQVYDSTLSRSGYMRSQNDVVKMATAFMGEPTTSFNMMLNAVVEAKRGTMSKGKAISNIAWTVTAGAAACILKSLFGAARKDDDDEAYLNKYVQVLAGNLLDELFIPNMLPFVKDVVSIMQGWDVERTDMALVKDLYDAFDGLFNDNKSLYRKIEDFGGAIGNFFGIPAKNIMRDARSLYNVVRSIFDDVKPENLLGDFANSFWGELVKSATLGRVDISKQSEQDRFLNYVKSGKSSEAKDYYASWIDSKKEEIKASREEDGKTELSEKELEKEAKSRIKSSVSAKLRPRYIEAYKNKDNETMVEIRYLMRDTGLYGGVSDIIDTCNGWVKEYKKP